MCKFYGAYRHKGLNPRSGFVLGERSFRAGEKKREGDERGRGRAGVCDAKSKKSKVTTIPLLTATATECNTPPTITVVPYCNSNTHNIHRSRLQTLPRLLHR